MTGPSEIEMAEWRGALGSKLDTIHSDLQTARAELATLRSGKDQAHNALYDRIREVEQGTDRRIGLVERSQAEMIVKWKMATAVIAFLSTVAGGVLTAVIVAAVSGGPT